jgi:acyl-homoserine lactone acylase PvdQ
MRARDWTSFRSAMQHIQTPACNVVYGDTQGNVAYQTTGSVPIRTSGHRYDDRAPCACDHYARVRQWQAACARRRLG